MSKSSWPHDRQPDGQSFAETPTERENTQDFEDALASLEILATQVVPDLSEATELALPATNKPAQESRTIKPAQESPTTKPAQESPTTKPAQESQLSLLPAVIPGSQPSLERTQDILARIDPSSKAAQNQKALSNTETSLALPSSPSQTMSPQKALEKGSPKSPKSPKKTPKKGSPSKSPKSLKKTPKKGSPRNRGFKRSRSAQSTSSQDKYSDGTYWKNLAYSTVTHVMLPQVFLLDRTKPSHPRMRRHFTPNSKGKITASEAAQKMYSQPGGRCPTHKSSHTQSYPFNLRIIVAT